MLCSLSLIIPSPSSASHHEHLGLLGILQSTHSTWFDAGLFYLSLSLCVFWHSNISVIKDNLFADNLLLTICNKYVLSYIVECLGATPCRHHQHHHRIPSLVCADIAVHYAPKRYLTQHNKYNVGEFYCNRT